MSPSDIKVRLIAYDSVQFGFVKKSNEDHTDTVFSDGIYSADWTTYTSFSYKLLDSKLFMNYADANTRTVYLQKLLLTALQQEEEKDAETQDQQIDSDVFEELYHFLKKDSNRHLIAASLKSIGNNKTIDLFSAVNDNLSLFEFLFFQCECHQIVQYVRDTYGVDELFENIVGTDLFNRVDQWIVSMDRSRTLFLKYPPSECTLDIVYEYDDNDRI